MNLDKFTQKAQEAILDAQRLAEEYHHQQLEPEHLLAALLRQADGVAPQVIQRIGADPRALLAEVEQKLAALKSRPRDAGIVYCRQQARSIGEMLRALILIWAVLTPEEMENHVEFL